MYRKVPKLSSAYKCSHSEGKHAAGTQVKKKDVTSPLPPPSTSLLPPPSHSPTTVAVSLI